MARLRQRTRAIVFPFIWQKNAQGSPAGTFAADVPRDYAAGTAPTSVAVGDINLDGFPDLAVSDADDNAVSVILNAGNGTFQTNIEFPVGTTPASIVSADFNADGRPDAAVANSGSADATVVLNTTALFGSGTGLLGSLFPGVQYLDIGMKMKATPRIHENNDVTLQLSLELTSLAGTSINSIPVISNQSVEQTVRLRENETGILAGFLQSQLSNAITGTPGIGELPIGNYLAGDQSLQRDESEVLILITPRLVRFENHENRRIYAGQGSLDNGAAAAPAALGGVANPGRFNPAGAQPAEGQPGQVNQPAGPPVQTAGPPAAGGEQPATTPAPPQNQNPNGEAPNNPPSGNEPPAQAPAPVITPSTQPQPETAPQPQ